MTSTEDPSPIRGEGWLKRLAHDARWIGECIRPNIRLTVKISADWHPIYRLRRWRRKAPCQNCGRIFRELEEGTICRREQLCGKCCLIPAVNGAAQPLEGPP
jgi:hypothetical protein